ncbi:phosphate ABC transporter permease subunit PstC [Sulfitobacter sp. SK011]|uniref:phosphate ABC transporter permease subunit PstC n=1 Tax=Sulfitobacter sp. SK011 TaxID=1389004 RepID=UPI000E0BA000|nr:phosphate ABC transporter permease subunit PstC [Sulfitobacter sp. SK011]AXI42460.1 phosphate ABC transporter permease subunit PstC [Sulfitobacter sp. SK011]
MTATIFGLPTPIALIFAVLGIALLGYVAARKRAVARAGGDARNLHSLPNFYGMTAAMFAAVPALGIMVIWLLAQPTVVQNAVLPLIPASEISSAGTQSLILSDVRRVADGLDIALTQGALTPAEIGAMADDPSSLRATLGNVGVALGSEVQPYVLAAAQKSRAISAQGRLWMVVVVLVLAVLGAAIAVRAADPAFRARNVVERGIMVLLIAAASLAILTTVGIVFSMLFESINFFRLHDWKDFFLGSTWAPNFRGDSDLSILPLLWGTLYISIIALLVAVPIGLFAAIYLSEYANSKVRSLAKPLLEILAGIPTIVYGLFALLTVGPTLVRIFGRGEDGLLGVDWMSGATSVLTAGLVMGIMLIPFVSSLSDDIINAVPQSLRDGSFGLGATHSETVRQVILPAALPGIVGAILLAASRAIGETMIVVLGAGAIARISANPLEAMTTITTRIVSQLTGDTDFASPETLVAFALGLTLFVLTLGLNVVALYIVRKYREQYE